MAIHLLPRAFTKLSSTAQRIINAKRVFSRFEGEFDPIDPNRSMTGAPFLLLKAPGLLDTLTEALKFLLKNPERS